MMHGLTCSQDNEQQLQLLNKQLNLHLYFFFFNIETRRPLCLNGNISYKFCQFNIKDASKTLHHDHLGCTHFRCTYRVVFCLTVFKVLLPNQGSALLCNGIRQWRRGNLLLVLCIYLYSLIVNMEAEGQTNHIEASESLLMPSRALSTTARQICDKTTKHEQSLEMHSG